MLELKGKKLLVLAGAGVHDKLVYAAHRLGVYVVVSDNVPNSSAKRIADKSYDVNIFDMEGLEEICQRESIDGILSCYIDPCQRPYYQLCEKLKMPCYGTADQFFKMTDKHAFKKMCIENEVPVIREYSLDNLESIEYPVFVKPVDSRGSRGQTVCESEEDLLEAVNHAKEESSNGDILIEKYMRDAHEFQVTYFFVNGKPYLIRTVDSYCGTEEKQLNKVVECAVSPSRYTQKYLDTTHEKVVKMFSGMGIKNGPVFMQGFEDHGEFRFFDPGFRFPGVDYEKIYEKEFHVDLMEAMVFFALTGKFPDMKIPEDGVFLNGKRAAVLFPTIKAGKIGEKKGVDEICKRESVVSYLPRWNVGANVPWSFNVNQRSAEIDILAENTEQLRYEIDAIQAEHRISDIDGMNMIYEQFNVQRIQ